MTRIANCLENGTKTSKSFAIHCHLQYWRIRELPMICFMDLMKVFKMRKRPFCIHCIFLQYIYDKRETFNKIKKMQYLPTVFVV